MASLISRGEQLLLTLSSRESVNRPSFNRLVEQVCGHVKNPGFFFWRTIRNFQALGHVEVDTRRRTHQIYICNSALVRLPTLGKPEYVLVGRRGGRVEEQLEKWVEPLGLSIHRDGIETGDDGVCPDRIVVRVGDTSSARKLADQLGIDLAEDFPAYEIVKTANSLSVYRDTLRFEETEHAYSGAPGKRFDRNKHQFVETLSSQQHVCPRLEQFSRAHSGEPVFFFVDRAGYHARVDRDWGRYLFLDSISQSPFTYVVSSHEFFSPGNVHLPILFDRSLCLCSGRPPRRVDLPGQGVKLRYGSVPELLAELIREKVGKLVKR